MAEISKIDLEVSTMKSRVKSLSSEGNLELNLVSKNEEEKYFAGPLSSDGSVKSGTSSGDLVGSPILGRQIKVEKVEAEEEEEELVAVEGEEREDGAGFSSETNHLLFSPGTSVKLEELPEVSDAALPNSADAEIDIKDEFNTLLPLLKSIKTETPTESLDAQNQSILKPRSDDLGLGSDSSPTALKQRGNNVGKIDKKSRSVKFICQRCQAPFSRKEYLRRHTKYHCENGPLHGLEVGSAVAPHGYFARNIPTTSTRPQCKECGKYFSRPDCVKKHFSRVHQKPGRKVKKGSKKPIGENSSKKPLFTCNHCQKTFKGRCNLSYHLSYHAQNTLKCKVCGEAFGNSYAYNRHMRWAHRERPAPKCLECGKVFGKTCDLKRHQMRRKPCCPKNNPAKRVKYTCEHCGYFCFRKDYLIRHFQCRRFCGFRPARDSHREPAEIVKYTCEHCGFSSFRKYRLLRHLKRRLQNPEEVCRQCCKRFTDPKKLREHSAVVHERVVEVSGNDRGESEHSRADEGAYVCDPCGLSFKQRGNFRRHVLSNHNHY